MTRDELLVKLRKLARKRDTEESHMEADNALTDYINDDEITKAYDAISKWYT